MKPEIKIVEGTDALYSAAAAEFVRAASDAVQQKGSFAVALSGGSTPKGMYSLLASDPTLRTHVPWDKVHFFWGDERHVAPDHPDSNFRMAHEALLSRVPVSAGQVWRIKAEYDDARRSADEYEVALRSFFGLAGGQFPHLDLVLLGMGPDGHTASLFPGTKALHESQRLAISNWVGKFYTHRITLTAPVLNNAAAVMFLVHGEDKAPVLKAVLEGPYEPDQLPAQLIRPDQGRVLWLVDQAASCMLATRIGSLT